MIPYLRRSSSNRELGRLMDHITSKLGFRDIAASTIRDDTFKLFSASDPRLAKRRSWRSAGALLLRAKRTGSSASSAVRRRSFEDDRVTKFEKVFFRRCLVAEIGQEYDSGYFIDETVLRNRYLKHLMFYGLSSKPSAFATALGGFLYGCGNDSLMAVYDSVLQKVLTAWNIEDALEIFQTAEAPEAAIRQAKASTRREMIERFRHLVEWRFEPDDFSDLPGFIDRIKSGPEVTDHYLKGCLQRIDRSLFHRAQPGINAEICSALNQILEDADLDSINGFNQAIGHRALPLAAKYQRHEIRNRRLLEYAYSDYIKPSLELLKPASRASPGKVTMRLNVIEDQTILGEFATFVEACGPWGIACDKSESPARLRHLAILEEDEGDAVDKAAADIKHVLAHQDCLKETSERARRECFDKGKPNMWLPSLARAEDDSNSAVGGNVHVASPGKLLIRNSRLPAWRKGLRKWSRQRRKSRPEKLILMVDCIQYAELRIDALHGHNIVHLEADGNANFVEVYGIDNNQSERVLLAACILEPRDTMRQTVSLGAQRFIFDVRYDDKYEIDFTYELIAQNILNERIFRTRGYLLDAYYWFADLRPVFRYSILLLVAVLFLFLLRPGIPRTFIAKLIPRESSSPNQPESPPSLPGSTQPILEESPGMSPTPSESSAPQRQLPTQPRPSPTATPIKREYGAPGEPVVARLFLPGHAGGSPPVIAIPKETLTLLLEFEKAELFDYAKYDGSLFASNSRQMAKEWSGIEAQIRDSQRTLTLTVPASRLSAGNYTLVITGKSADGRVGNKQTIYLNFVSQP